MGGVTRLEWHWGKGYCYCIYLPVFYALITVILTKRDAALNKYQSKTDTHRARTSKTKILAAYAVLEERSLFGNEAQACVEQLN